MRYNAPKYSKEETDKIHELAEDMPFTLLVREYQRWAKEAGYPARSRHALRGRIQRLGYSFRSYGKWLDVMTAAELWQVTGETVRYWTRRGDLSCHHEGFKVYVSRHGLKKLARARPYLFHGIPYDNLLALLDSEKLAQRLSAVKIKKISGRRSRVRCVETGRVFPSVKAAADSIFVTRQSIGHAIWGNRTCQGFHWERLD